MKNTGKKNKKVIGAVCAALGCLVIAGVGYGAWVIVADISSDEGNVSVGAEHVEDNRITLRNYNCPAAEDGESAYEFGPTTGGSLIQPSNTSVSEENLAVSFSFEVTYDTTFNSTMYINLSLTCNQKVGEGTAAENEAYAGLIGSTTYYLEEPITSTNKGGTAVTIATIGVSDGAATVTANSTYTNTTLTAEAGTSSAAGIKVTVSDSETQAATGKAIKLITVDTSFGWGKYFNYVNPANWAGTAYSDGASTIEDVITGLEAIDDAFPEESNGSTVTNTFDYGVSVESTSYLSDD